MTLITLRKNSKPKVVLPEMACDIKLHNKLDNFALTAQFNRSFSAGVIGKPGTGKTSLITGFLATKHLFNKVFYNIFLFMPPNSRSSIKDSVFDKLPKERIKDNLTQADLSAVYDTVKKNSKNNKFTLIILDDVQQHLKGECEEILIEMLSNRRHLRLCIFMVAQTYKKIPRSCRMLFSDYFFFEISKSDLLVVYDELIQYSKQQWFALLKAFNTIRKKTNGERFLYINSQSQKFFVGWDELHFESESESEQDAESESDSE
jgi:hypothetical protein